MTDQEWQLQPDPADQALYLSREPAGEHRRPETPTASVVAWFEDEGAARACFHSLEARGVQVTLVAETPGGAGVPGAGATPGDGPGAEAANHPDGAAAQGEDGVPDEDGAPPPTERGMGRGAVVGASVGATAGLLAASYLVPSLGGAPATGAMLTTLAGAGLGSFLGNLADQGLSQSGGGDESVAPGGRTGFRLQARAEPGKADEVMALIAAWGPLEVKVQQWPGRRSGG